MSLRYQIAELAKYGFVDKLSAVSADLVFSASILPGENLIIISFARFSQLVSALREQCRQ